jgi:hypothetical protein
MKRIVIILLIFLTFPLLRLTAQESNLEKLNAFKIGFFTRRLNLTSAEAEKFWPIYNEYQDNRNKVQLEKVSIIRDFSKNKGSLNDKQLTEMGDKLMGLITQESTLAVEFHKRLKGILTPAKVIMFYLVENQYKVVLLNQLQGNQQKRSGTVKREF